MVFEGENKILDEDVIKRTSKFIQTAFEWLAIHGTLIVRETLATQAGNQFYEVPVNKIFFLVACSLNIENISTNSSYDGKLAVDQQSFDFGSSTSLVFASATALTGDPNANSVVAVSFSIPLKFVAGFKFFGYDNPSTQGNTTVLIQGYEIDQNLFQPGF